jgi:hypothetical protein
MQKRGPTSPLLVTSWHEVPQIRNLPKATDFHLYMKRSKAICKALRRLSNEHPNVVQAIYINEATAYEGRGGIWDA